MVNIQKYLEQGNRYCLGVADRASMSWWEYGMKKEGGPPSKTGKGWLTEPRELLSYGGPDDKTAATLKPRSRNISTRRNLRHSMYLWL
jgi:hypothetical protein